MKWTRREGGNCYLISCLSEGILRIAAKTFEKSMRECRQEIYLYLSVYDMLPFLRAALHSEFGR